MTVKELRDLLADKPADFEVKCWLPGSRIVLSAVILMTTEKVVLIEGNVAPSSALSYR